MDLTFFAGTKNNSQSRLTTMPTGHTSLILSDTINDNDLLT